MTCWHTGAWTSCKSCGRECEVTTDGRTHWANCMKCGKTWEVKGKMKSSYTQATMKRLRKGAMKIKGAKKVSHIYPRAYCVAKPAPLCAVFVTPVIDAEPQVRDKCWSAARVVSEGVGLVRVGDWCAIAYVSTPGCGQLHVIEHYV